ncbi:acetate kinase [Ruegeria marisrubri]|uniref:Acetate kinase n=1 Tax=Ruegeria marisrubri TaxID=1685379 RepID=A0A0X3TL88_9RHOB|nr:acetate kinase [Ruegeria marisrubri]KUJ76542.1 acetate kinase [Ruegeria marisrubri]
MILVVNAGSSSIKIELFEPDLTSLLSGSVSEIGGDARLTLGGDKRPVEAPDHVAAINELIAGLEAQGYRLSDLAAAGHRIVHGGAEMTQPVRLTSDVLRRIEAFTPLAPLHNPHNLVAIYALTHRLPDLPQFGSFDTAFHASNPRVATEYALPKELRALGLRRYGFHGLSYASMVEHFGEALPRRLLGLHLGNGASLCAMLDGRSVATSMGYSPLEGLTMGTRSGSIDGMLVLRLAGERGIDETDRLLNLQSGLKGLAGTNDMAAILARDDDEARFAVEHFCYWAARHAGSAIVAMGGLDAVAFTGGIGENAAAVRDRIMEHLAFLGEVPVHVVPADEERQIARDTLRLLAQDTDTGRKTLD